MKVLVVAVAGIAVAISIMVVASEGLDDKNAAGQATLVVLAAGVAAVGAWRWSQAGFTTPIQCMALVVGAVSISDPPVETPWLWALLGVLAISVVVRQFDAWRRNHVDKINAAGPGPTRATRRG